MTLENEVDMICIQRSVLITNTNLIITNTFIITRNLFSVVLPKNGFTKIYTGYNRLPEIMKEVILWAASSSNKISIDIISLL